MSESHDYRYSEKLSYMNLEHILTFEVKFDTLFKMGKTQLTRFADGLKIPAERVGRAGGVDFFTTKKGHGGAYTLIYDNIRGSEARYNNDIKKGIDVSQKKYWNIYGYEFLSTEKDILAFKKWTEQVCTKYDHPLIEESWNPLWFKFLSSHCGSNNTMFLLEDFKDWTIKYLGVSKFGSTFTRDKNKIIGNRTLGIVSALPTPHIDLWDEILETKYPVQQLDYYLDFEVPTRTFIQKEPTLLQRTANRNAKEKLERILGKEL